MTKLQLEFLKSKIIFRIAIDFFFFYFDITYNIRLPLKLKALAFPEDTNQLGQLQLGYIEVGCS